MTQQAGRPEVAAILADTDLGLIYETRGPNVQYRHLDGTPLTGRDLELLKSATAADLELAKVIWQARAEQSAAEMKDMDRLREIMSGVTGWATVNDALAMLSPGLRAEAEAIMHRLVPGGPDGYITVSRPVTGEDE